MSEINCGYNSSQFLHFRNGYIFWTDTSSDRIYRAFINGSNPMIIVNTGLSCAGKLFFATVASTLSVYVATVTMCVSVIKFKILFTFHMRPLFVENQFPVTTCIIKKALPQVLKGVEHAWVHQSLVLTMKLFTLQTAQQNGRACVHKVLADSRISQFLPTHILSLKSYCSDFHYYSSSHPQ